MEKSTSDQPKRCCHNCHFLVTDDPPTPLANEERQKLLHEIQNGQIQSINPRCFHDVWNILNLGVHKDTFEKISCPSRVDLLIRERNDSCFFYPYEHWMSLNAAKELERRDANRREADKDRQITQDVAHKARTISKWALLISLFSIIATIVIRLF